VLIENIQRPKDLPVIGSVVNKVIRPDMIAVLWPQPQAGSVIQPEPPFLGLFHRYFQPLTSPQAFNALVSDLPAGISQQSRNPAISISTILSHQFDHVRHQALFIRSAPWFAALR
jgi:hypothetical protein